MDTPVGVRVQRLHSLAKGTESKGTNKVQDALRDESSKEFRSNGILYSQKSSGSPQLEKEICMNTDPIADMLTRIRNANVVSHPSVEMPSSKLKVALARLLKEEGYISNYSEKTEGCFKTLSIELKYDEANKPVISKLKRVSKPGLRNYCKAKNLPQVLGGMGIAIVSTSKGLLTDRKARKENLGGEILAYIY